MSASRPTPRAHVAGSTKRSVGAGELPSYRAVFEREGVTSPGGTVLAGDEAAVERGMRRFAEAGVSEVQIVPVGTPEEKSRTLTVLGAFGDL